MIIFDILIFLIILSIVVLVHELGHFWGAKLTGVKVEEFGIGFPPKIWKKKIGETEYSIGALPFGGYNKIYGMDEIDDEKDKDPRGYERKGFWVKALICLGGVVMNLIFAVFLFYFLVIGSGFKMSQTMIITDYKFPFGTQIDRPLVLDVSENSPAQMAGLKFKDIIVSINGDNINSLGQFINTIDSNLGKNISLGFIDAETEEIKTVDVTLRSEKTEDQGALGVSYGDMSYIEYKSLSDKLLCGFYHTYNFVDYSIRAMGTLIGNSVEEKSIEPLANSMSGPIGIFAITKIVAQEGIIPLINLIALLSIAIGVTNLLPIPAMDGAKTIFLGLELINKKIFTKELQMKVEQIGMIFLIILALVMVFKDFFQFKDIIFK